MPNNVYKASDYNRNVPSETVVESKTEADLVNGVLTFDELIFGIEIYNKDATNTGVFVVSGILITVPSHKVYRSPIGGKPVGKTVVVTGSTNFEVRRLI